MILSRKHSCTGPSYQADQLESSCLVDAAIAFCKLQHLDPMISIKVQQVDLIVAVHDLLAEYGLCCAGRDGEGEEGTSSNPMGWKKMQQNMTEQKIFSEPYSDVYGNLYYYIAQVEDISATDKYTGLSWLYAFYLGKLCEKLGHSPTEAFSYYNKAATLNPTAVDPVYRMHASRMKLLYTRGKQNLDAIQVAADYTYKQSTKEHVLSMLQSSVNNVQNSSSDHNDKCALDRGKSNIGGSRKNLEVSLSESSRKFITCIRKYMILYLNLLEKNRDLWTLERAYTYLRTDKRFALCLGDIVPVGLGKYLQVLTSAIRTPEVRRVSGDASVEHLLEKMFGVFMDHANLWADISTIPEVNSPELSESNLYSYIHQYIHLLESDVRLDVLEGLNEKIRKRFKTPKLSNSNFAKICKHASLAWCRCILIKLASITPLPESMVATDQRAPLSNGLKLYIDLQPDELLISSPDGPAQFKGLDMNWFETFNRIRNIPVRQTSEDNLETAVTVMKSTYNFYRESSCGTFPSAPAVASAPPQQELGSSASTSTPQLVTEAQKTATMAASQLTRSSSSRAMESPQDGSRANDGTA
ncbi:hypothetical protein GUJ93_ZPchr0003g17862 [Zizania palustris]|uniref:Uncharacterized protein n=1 Tax=Zizania palustris TaxID=103762 RepID=A0A8J5VXE6_ZIZPA|nr:hypothetical protein GUJ93_ZPchr0003g17862 [Zizania palustris]